MLLRLFCSVIVFIITQYTSVSGQPANVVYKQINENGLIGYLALPDTINRFPAIITLKGAGGGLSTFYPHLLSQHGYVVFSLAYSGLGHLPKSEKEMPIEYFEKAIHWLKKHPNVDSTKLGIIGTSLGAEAALITASFIPTFKAVISIVGTHVAWQYSEMGMKDTIPYSHWKFRGRPVPFVPLKLTTEIYQKGINTGQWGEMFSLSLKDKKAVKKAVIPVEKINAPILLLSGQDDAIWPSSYMSNAIINRLKKKKYKHEHRHISYPETGHMLFVTKDGNTGGGTGKGARFADEDSQKQIISFLNKYLKNTR